MRAKKTFWGAAAILFALSGDAMAAPEPAAQVTLASQIRLARTSDPATFRVVREPTLDAQRLDRRARNGKAPIALRLRSLGPKALLPMLELLSSDVSGVPQRARLGIRRDLIEAVGLLRDARAVPPLAEVLAKDPDPDMTRTAAEALARIETDEAVTLLQAALAGANGERRLALLAGMGSCRREAIATTLADALAQRPDAATARIIARSLGRVGNAWAWKTLSRPAEEEAARRTATEALVAAYARYTGEAREAAAKALLVVDHPRATSLVEETRRGANAETALALDALARRIAANPTR
jgi:HEAT repeat protein